MRFFYFDQTHYYYSFLVVEVLGGWLKLSDQGERLQTLVDMVPSGAIQPIGRKPRQVQRRLQEPETSRLVAGYQAGMTVRELAARHRISRQTVSAILERQGVPRRYKLLSPEQILEVIDLYAQGQSLIMIGKRYQVNASTVRNALLKAGVGLRDSHGREPGKAGSAPSKS